MKDLYFSNALCQYLPVNSFYVVVANYGYLFSMINRTGISVVCRNNSPSWCFTMVCYIPFCYAIFRVFSVCNISLYVIVLCHSNFFYGNLHLMAYKLISIIEWNCKVINFTKFVFRILWLLFDTVFQTFFQLKLTSPYQRNTIQMLLFELFDKLIRFDLVEDSQTLS